MAQRERMISAAKLVTVLAKKCRYGMIHYDDLMATIADIPTLDAVEVVHGEWGHISEDCCVCSVCHKSAIVDYYFCPECGAKMDGGNDDA